jgi:hypothetical protein
MGEIRANGSYLATLSRRARAHISLSVSAIGDVANWRATPQGPKTVSKLHYCTFRETVPVCVRVPEVPVTVTVYVPGVVPPPPPPPPPPTLPPPPQPSELPMTEKSSASIPSLQDHLRHLAGMATSKMHARATPLTAGQKDLRLGLTAALGAVVFTLRVAVCGVEPLIVTEAGTLHVAGSLGAVGVIAQLRLTTPVNPPDGVTVSVAVPLLPAVIVSEVGLPETVKPGGGADNLKTVPQSMPFAPPNSAVP